MAVHDASHIFHVQSLIHPTSYGINFLRSAASRNPQNAHIQEQVGCAAQWALSARHYYSANVSIIACDFPPLQLAWAESCASQRVPAVPSTIIREKHTNL
jgi:hypothetical protein